ncbi:4Fe-4S binding protein [Paucidesulfovibrio longus]|uniref:4Fe-4S binding protein n=1 Tax=Paucidesulfovibrio longus TaxID=889 RepID=UPI0003B4BE7C|nr:4Fe-4S binding protein [Paucidesulfovibrio longus]
MKIVPAYLFDTCRGARSGQCPHLLPVAPEFEPRLEGVICESGWPEFLEESYAGKHHYHHAFRVAVSGCPNGCSRPHIQDIGLIRSMRPVLDPERCSSCGICGQSCPDSAILMRTASEMGLEGAQMLPEIDPGLCLRCGHCVRVCPTGAMRAAEEGWRIVVGGRLGRRPALGRELPGLHSDEEALEVVERALRLYMDNWRRGLRFGVLLDETGLEPLSSGVRI